MASAIDIDVAVVGLGTMGAMAAWRLSETHGGRVVGFEQFGLGHGHGAAAGESRLIRLAYHEGPDYVPLLKRARDLWVELGVKAGREILLPSGVLSVGAESTRPMQGVLASVHEHELSHELLTTQELAARYPQHRQVDDEIGVLDLGGGVLRSELGIASALRLAKANGAELHAHDQVFSVTEVDGGVEIIAASGRYLARKAVVTSGVWTDRLLPETAASLTYKPLVLTWFLPERPEEFVPEVFPAFIRDTVAGTHLFGMPVMDGVSVKAGFADEWGEIAGYDALERWRSEVDLRRVSAEVASLIPGLGDTVMRHSVHMDAYTPDRRAMIGDPTGGGNIVVAAGFSGHGFKLAPVVGQTLTDMVVGKPAGLDVSRFAPDRFLAETARC